MAVYKPSPNQTPGRQGKRIDRIVIHWIVGTLASADAAFSRPGVSAHYGIENGNVHQYVSESNTAWHAGDWNFNLRSIGIEHSAAPGRPATEATIQTSIKLVTALCKKYGIKPSRSTIIKHNEVVKANGQRVATQCCGTIPIDRIVKEVQKALASPAPKPTPAPSKGTYKLVKTVAGYVNAADAKARKNKKTTVKAGTYYVFNTASGMVNVTTKKGVPGSWINPGDNKASAPAKPSTALKVGDTVVFTKAVDYNGSKLYVSGKYKVMEIKGSRVVVGRGGVVTAAVNKANLKKA